MSTDPELVELLDAQMTLLAINVGAGIAQLLEHGVKRAQERDPTLYGRIADASLAGFRMQCVVVAEPDLTLTAEMVRVDGSRVERLAIFEHRIANAPDADDVVH